MRFAAPVERLEIFMGLKTLLTSMVSHCFITNHLRGPWEGRLEDGASDGEDRRPPLLASSAFAAAAKTMMAAVTCSVQVAGGGYFLHTFLLSH